MSLLIILALVVIASLILFYLFSTYNMFVALRNRYKNAFSQIDVQLKRRYDLIPNLVESAKGYLVHERSTLEEVIKARNTAFDANKVAAANLSNAAAMTDLMQAEEALNGTIGRLLAVIEAYPNLKANETVRHLMEELTSTENRISFARQAYNDNVTEYNTARELFPNNILFNFEPAILLESIDTPEERKAPKVSFK